MSEQDYRQGMEIFLLLNADQVQSVMGTWVDCNWECDLRISRSRQHKGLYVIRTFNLMWANRIIKWYGCEKVTYREPQRARL